MCIPYAPRARPEWFDPGLCHVILGSCPGQCAPLNRPCFEPGTHSFASSDGDDCLAPRHWRSQVTACHQETSGLFRGHHRGAEVGRRRRLLYGRFKKHAGGGTPPRVFALHPHPVQPCRHWPRPQHALDLEDRSRLPDSNRENMAHVRMALS